ncbi:Gfo/Idh/MocA family protein [Aureimonas sp. AU20]|uniref:Gfo/Idh/MocA family protein n=1 Tax=Aureimonas sp. AU20 TaxID=1349819 RepID=UPI00072282EC|nr:Gfo/Idh/MocA family oxidoreductase [Aureimonas sp. AU20]ALN75205.1 hypothetical protein M673_20950 [Aureimonas sp. AU20]
MHRVIVVGCGAMSHVWFEAAAARSDLEIVAAVDLDLKRAEDCLARHGLGDARAFTDFAKAVRESRADIVFDIAVPSARSAIVRAALESGCHVLSEKPMAETLDEARSLVDAARRAGRHHVVIQNRRYLEPVRRIRDFLASGAIGEVTSTHCDFFLAPRFGGFREEMAHVLLLDMAVHTFDAARFLTGENAISVYAEEWEPSSSWYRQGSSAAALFRMESGALFSYRGSWCARGRATPWEAEWRIVGTLGTLTWDGAERIEAEVVDPEHRDGLFETTRSLVVPPLGPDARVGGHAGVMRDFLEAIANGRAAETDGSSNIQTLAMVHGAIQSAETGQRVAISV